uniref:Uncharacterized protein n=1 Tax=Ditylenchus dipsaci TaxID=166011 RepID=A0A915D2Q1_9BILA
MDIFRRWANIDNSLVTPDNQPNIMQQQQEQLLRAPRGPPFRSRHFSDGSVQFRYQPANQNRELRSASGQQQQPRMSVRDQIARGIIEFASGYPNTRAHHRRLLASKSVTSSFDPLLSAAHPMSFARFFFDDLARPPKFDEVLQLPPLMLTQKRNHAWNPDDRSINIYVKEDDPLTLHRYPVAQSTDCIHRLFAWLSCLGVDLVCNRAWHSSNGWRCDERGIAAQEGYSSLLGSDTESYGWDINKKKCYHDSQKTQGWLYPKQVEKDFQVPSKFYCILDMDEGYMAFATHESVVWGHCEITIDYMGGLAPSPRSLMDFCRREIRMRTAANCDQLELSRGLQNTFSISGDDESVAPLPSMLLTLFSSLLPILLPYPPTLLAEAPTFVPYLHTLLAQASSLLPYLLTLLLGNSASCHTRSLGSDTYYLALSTHFPGSGAHSLRSDTYSLAKPATLPAKLNNVIDEIDCGNEAELKEKLKIFKCASKKNTSDLEIIALWTGHQSPHESYRFLKQRR